MVKQQVDYSGRRLGVLFLCLVSLFCARFVEAASPGFVWTKTARGSGSEVSYDLAVDSHKSCFIAGYFSSTNLVFDNITISNCVRTAGPTSDCFLANLSSNGVVQWAKAFGGTNNDRAFCVAVDAQGNSYVAGWFASTNFFIGNIKLTNNMTDGSTAFFVAKFSPWGQPLWARCPDKNYSTSVIGLAVDASNNVYVTGSIVGTNIIGGTNFVVSRYPDVLLLKYDSAGNLVWGQHPGGPDSDAGQDLAVDNEGNLYLSVTFRGTNAAFGDFLFTCPANEFGQLNDIIVVKYNPDGTALWGRQFGGPLNEIARGIAVDSQHNCYITGEYQGTNIVIGDLVLTNNSVDELFLAKLSPDGTPLWAKAAHGDDVDSAWKIAVDAAGNSYIGGYFQSSYLTLDNVTLTNFEHGDFNAADALVAKFDTDGNLLWTSHVRAENEQRVFSLAVNDDVLYATGWTMGTNVYFGNTSTTNAYLDLFVSRLQTDFPRMQYVMTNQSGTNVLQLSWAANPNFLILEVSTNLQTWELPGGSFSNVNGQIIWTVPVDRSHFFRLQRF